MAEGNEDALATLYELHGGLIYRFSLRMVQDESVAEEITQDVFLALLRQGHQFDPNVARLSTWLCGIARRLIWKHLERARRFKPLEASDDRPPGDAAGATDPGVLLSRKEAAIVVQRGIDRLPPDLREVLVLCELEELKYEDAAVALHIPIGTVRSRLYRAKRQLAALLQNERSRSAT